MSFNLDLLIGGINHVIRQQNIDKNNEMCEYFVNKELEEAEREAEKAELQAYREIPPGFFDSEPYLSNLDKERIRNADRETLDRLGVVKENALKLKEQVAKDRAIKDDVDDFSIDFNMEDLS